MYLVVHTATRLQNYMQFPTMCNILIFLRLVIFQISHFIEISLTGVRCNQHLDHLTPTILPSRVYSLLTTPESSLMASVMSVMTCSNECAVFLLSKIRTALRGFTPLRTMVTNLGLMKSLLSLVSGDPAFPLPREEGSRTDMVVLAPNDQLGFTFFVYSSFL